MKRTKFLLTLAVLASIVVASTACPSGSDVKKAYRVSESLSQTIEIAADGVGSLYTAQLIPFDLKETIVARLRQSREGGKKFHQAVDAAFKLYAEHLPDDQINALDLILSADVVKPMTDILVDIRVLPPEIQAKVLAILVVARQALLTIIGIFIRGRGQASANYDQYIRATEVLKNADA